MKRDLFVKRVRRIGNLADLDEAGRVTDAFLRTMGERLSGTERHHLSSQLHKDLKSFLQEPQNKESFGLDEFYNRVAARANLGRPEAIRAARAVGTVLCEAVSDGEIRDVLAEMPGFEGVFGM